jgi:prepilin-type N-terminal cleavage/methylation domain-containing protein
MNFRAPSPKEISRHPGGNPFRPPAFGARTSPAFTLIELILVMGVLATLAAIVIPNLSGFLKGQDVAQEGKRFVALTQLAHSEAISTGVAHTLWINPVNKTYGLREPEGFSENTNSGKIYTLGEKLDFELDSYAAKTFGEFAIRFLPDGDIEEGSITNLAIERLDDERLWIALSTNGFAYEILGRENL